MDAFMLRWSFRRAELQDAVQQQPAFKRQRRVGRRVLLIAPVACILVAVRPTWVTGGLLAGLLPAWVLVETAPRLTVWQQWRANQQLRGELEVTVSATGVRAQSPATRRATAGPGP